MQNPSPSQPSRSLTEFEQFLATHGWGTTNPTIRGIHTGSFCSCCGASIFKKNEQGRFAYPGWDAIYLNQGKVPNPSGGGNVTLYGNSRRIFGVVGASKEEALKLAYSEGYLKQHPVEVLELTDPECETFTISWVNE